MFSLNQHEALLSQRCPAPVLYPSSRSAQLPAGPERLLGAVGPESVADPGSPGSRGETEAPEPWPRAMPPAWHTGSLSRRRTRAPRTKRNWTFGRGKAVPREPHWVPSRNPASPAGRSCPRATLCCRVRATPPRPQSSSHARCRGPCASTLDGLSWQGLQCLHRPSPFTGRRLRPREGQ